jgi:hypothetical protein
MKIVFVVIVVLVACATVRGLTVVQNTSTPEGIVSTARAFLSGELMQGTKWNKPFFAFRPSLPGSKYGASSWLWDQSAQMTVLSRLNVTEAVLCLRTMLQWQDASGFIPEIVNWGDQTLAQEAAFEAYYGNQQITPITRSPVLGFALAAMVGAVQTQSDKAALISEFLGPIVRYNDWWLRTRDPFDIGLVSIVHSWESGMDASPAYDEAYGLKTAQPWFLELYPRFVELCLEYHAAFNWNLDEIVNRNGTGTNTFMDYFSVYDTSVNSILAGSYRLASDLASAAGDASLAQHCKRRQLALESAIVANLWLPSENRFASALYARNGQLFPARAETAQSLFPLLLATLPSSMVSSIVASQLTNSSRFWLNFPVPSVSAADAAFQPDFGVNGDLMWRGPTWPVQTWYVLQGLLLHNETGVAHALFSRWLAVVTKSGIFEQYQPITGTTFGPEGLSMSLLIADAVCAFIPGTSGCN